MRKVKTIDHGEDGDAVKVTVVMKMMVERHLDGQDSERGNHGDGDGGEGDHNDD